MNGQRKAGGRVARARVRRRLTPADRSMSLRQWAESREVPLSTAHKAAKAGRITRRADGRLDPEKADREWMERTREHVNARVPRVPLVNEAEAARAQAVDAAAAQLLADLKKPADWCGDPGDEMMSVRVALVVNAHADLMHRAALHNMVERLAPTLALTWTPDAVREALLGTVSFSV